MFYIVNNGKNVILGAKKIIRNAKMAVQMFIGAIMDAILSSKSALKE